MKSNEQIIDIYSKVILKVALAVLGVYLLYVIRDIIALFFVAVVIMAAIDPLVTWFGKSKIPRPVGVLMIYVTLISVIGASFYVLIPAIASQFKEFMNDLPQYAEKLNSVLSGVNINTHEVGQKISEEISGYSVSIFSKTVGIFSGVFSFIVVFSMAFYMSIIKDGMEKFLDALTPRRYKTQVIGTALKIKDKIGRWMLGQLIAMLLIFTLDYTILYFLDVPYALAIAILGGLMEIVPYVGPVVSATIATTIGFLVSPVKGLLVLLFYVIIQQIENHVIVPQIMKRAVGLNPLFIVFALLVGMKVAGVAGVILAVPFATAVNVVIEGFSKNGE